MTAAWALVGAAVLTASGATAADKAPPEDRPVPHTAVFVQVAAEGTAAPLFSRRLLLTGLSLYVGGDRRWMTFGLGVHSSVGTIEESLLAQWHRVSGRIELQFDRFRAGAELSAVLLAIQRHTTNAWLVGFGLGLGATVGIDLYRFSPAEAVVLDAGVGADIVSSPAVFRGAIALGYRWTKGP